MIRRSFFLLVFTIILAQGNAQQVMTLEDCVQYAFAHSPDITLAQLDIRDANWQIKENTAIGLPNFTIGANYQHFLKQPSIPADAFGFDIEPATKLTFALKNNLSGTIGVSELLFSRSYLLGIKAAREYRNYVDLKLEAAKVKVRNAVTDAYLPALLLQENIDIMDKNVEVQQRFLAQTEEIQKAGFAEQLDVDRLQYALSTMTSERENLVRQREILIDLLQFAMNMPVEEDIALKDDMTALLDKYASISPDEELNYMQRAEYVAVLKARELSNIQVALYEKTWIPSVTGFAQYQPSYQGNDKLYWIPSAIVGLQLNIPIYDGGMTKARRERATVTSLQVDVQKETLEQAFKLEYETARKQFANARARVDNETANLALAQRIYDSAQTKFQAGLGMSLEVTEAQSGLYASQARLMQARYDLLQARVAMKKALGK